MHARVQRIDLVAAAFEALQREATRLAQATNADVLVDADGMTVAARDQAVWARERGAPDRPPDAVLARRVADERESVFAAVAAAVATAVREA
jgi:hypothetical protein